MTTITINIPEFREQFPQFADAAKFPDTLVQTQFDVACVHISPDTYGDMTPNARTQALYLMTAHLLALGVIIAQNGYTGQPGIVTAATVDSVQITLQPPPVRGHWRWWLNTTPYGAQLVALLDALSVGGFFVGGLPERAAFRRVNGGFGGVY